MAHDTHRPDASPVAAIEVRSIEELGAAIRRLRRGRGWTQSELADWVGTNRFTVHRLEAGGPVGLPVAIRAIAILGHAIILTPRGSGSPPDGRPARG